MSADHWGQCPKCWEGQQKKRKKAIEDTRKAAEDSYGKVSSEEFLRLREVADGNAGSAEIDTETFREDYEIFTDKEGLLYISYCGSCTECGFQVKFHHEKQTL